MESVIHYVFGGKEKRQGKTLSTQGIRKVGKLPEEKENRR